LSAPPNKDSGETDFAATNAEPSYTEARHSSADFRKTVRNEIDAPPLWVSAAKSDALRLALLGIFATFFTWGLAYVFEYIADPSVVNLAAFITFFSGSIVAIVLVIVQHFYYRRPKRGRRRGIRRLIKKLLLR